MGINQLNYLNLILKKIDSYTAKKKLRRLILLTFDCFVLICALFISFNFELLQNVGLNINQLFWLLPSILFVGILIFSFTGRYKSLTKYISNKYIYKTLLNCFLITLTLYFCNLTVNKLPLRLNNWLILWVVMSYLATFSKIILRDILLKISDKKNSKKVAIYGAGAAGAQLGACLSLANNYKTVFFIDDEPSLWSRELYGAPIIKFEEFTKRSNEIECVLIAIPSLKNKKLLEIFKKVNNLNVDILQIPSIDEITSGKEKIDKFRPIRIEDLLGRDPIYPQENLLGPGIENANILVTGAGGSIGSELSRQILNLNPLKLVLLENCELNLYSIFKELQNNNSTNTEIIPILANSCDFKNVLRILKKHNINTLFHAAAYKHVPLVEMNPLEGIKNNVTSTRVICEAAHMANLDKVILISTDKAVRPPNVMGASKRLAELIVQSFNTKYKLEKNHTIYSMVRFGNVLGSSGSVVPLFQEQIKNGGPITLTDPNVIRYFMTIKEASQLVIQSSVLGVGGDVFLLDMGDPVKIIDLAEQMISINGLTKKDEANPNGNIEIKTIGLRDGEKLYEELLIGSESKPTSHPLIFRAVEDCIHPDILWEKLDLLEKHLSNIDQKNVFKILSELVPEWKNVKKQ